MPRHCSAAARLGLRRVEFDWTVRLGLDPLAAVDRGPLRHLTGRAVDVALYRCADVDALPPAHSEADWGQLGAIEKGRRSPLAALAKQTSMACRRQALLVERVCGARNKPPGTVEPRRLRRPGAPPEGPPAALRGR